MTVQPIQPVLPATPTGAATTFNASPHAAAKVATQLETLAAQPDVQATAPLDVASQASGVLGIFGVSGAGKTTQATEAIKYCWEIYHKIALVISSDLGGWGNSMLSLIRLGIARAWYCRNHVDAFATLELATLGGFPVEILDPDTGYADPHVEIVLPRQVKWVPLCPNGHPIARFANEPQMTAALTSPGRSCPTCQTVTLLTNVLRIDRVIVRPALFDNVGLYVFDSMTQINDWGMADLVDQSAKGLLPIGKTGGSALGSANALESGGFRFGTSSLPQVGFLQNRTYSWIANVRSIPGQVVPAVMTFGEEASKGDDESGGQAIMGPRIAGNARTSAVPGWLGNCLHLTKEPHNPPLMYENGEIVLHHRIWTTTHIMPHDPRHVPYLAKHRGAPGGAMPPFLEDAEGAEPFSTCSLKVFLTLLATQLAEMEARDRERYTDTPDVVDGTGDVREDTVIGEAPALGTVPGAMPVVAVAEVVAPVPVGLTPVVVPVLSDAVAGVIVQAAAVEGPGAPPDPLKTAVEAAVEVAAAGPAGNAPIGESSGGPVHPAPAAVTSPVVSAATTTRLQRTPRPPTV